MVFDFYNLNFRFIIIISSQFEKVCVRTLFIVALIYLSALYAAIITLIFGFPVNINTRLS